MTNSDMYYLLLNKVQNLDCFEAVLNGYLRKDNMDVYVTGNNSKFYANYDDKTDYTLDDYTIYYIIGNIFDKTPEQKELSKNTVTKCLPQRYRRKVQSQI